MPLFGHFPFPLMHCMTVLIQTPILQLTAAEMAAKQAGRVTGQHQVPTNLHDHMGIEQTLDLVQVRF